MPNKEGKPQFTEAEASAACIDGCTTPAAITRSIKAPKASKATALTALVVTGLDVAASVNKALSARLIGNLSRG